MKAGSGARKYMLYILWFGLISLLSKQRRHLLGLPDCALIFSLRQSLSMEPQIVYGNYPDVSMNRDANFFPNQIGDFHNLNFIILMKLSNFCFCSHFTILELKSS